MASLADDLFATSHARFWIVDYFSAEAQKYRRRKGINRAMQNAPASRLWLSPERQKTLRRFAGYALLEQSDSPFR